GRDNARSTGGDLDLTIYSLREWARLALKGNPTIMLLLFTPADQLVYCDDLGAELRALTSSIVSRRVQGPFLGYLQAQKQRLTGGEDRNESIVLNSRRCTGSTPSTRCTCCDWDFRVSSS